MVGPFKRAPSGFTHLLVMVDKFTKWRRAKAYTIVKGELHKRSVSRVFQRCVSPEEGVEILREIHEGECGHHAAAKSLVAKAFLAYSSGRCRTIS